LHAFGVRNHLHCDPVVVA